MSATEDLARIQLAERRRQRELDDYEAAQRMRTERLDSNGDPLDSYGPRPQLDESRSYYTKEQLSPDELEEAIEQVHDELNPEVLSDVEKLPDHVRERAHRELYGDRADQVESGVKPSRVTTVEDADGRNKMKVESYGDSYMRFSLEDEP